MLRDIKCQKIIKEAEQQNQFEIKYNLLPLKFTNKKILKERQT